MAENRFPRAALEFDKNLEWKRAKGGLKTTWRKLVSDELEPMLKPYRMTKQKWKEKWQEEIQETTGNRSQWRGIIRDLQTDAGNGQ